MTVSELIGNMYYAQKLRILECDESDRLKKKLLYSGSNHELRSSIYKPLCTRKVIGFGVGVVHNTTDINVE